MTGASVRPTTILIAALGGEGGGVLSKWVVEAAETANLWVQFTSVPGVAQRTGATTYYIEMLPRDEAADGRAPVMALLPSPGAVDVVVASELLEAGRAIQNGFVTPDCTTLIASTHRIYAIAEKSAMGDGRFDGENVMRAASQMAKRMLMADMGKLARQAGSVINAVLLGAMAGAKALPVPREAFEDAIRRGGIAVEENLAGFALGYDLAESSADAGVSDETPAPEARQAGDAPTQRVEQGFPEPARPILLEGVKRLIDYQDADYADVYLDRLQVVRDLDTPDRDYALTAETGRHLAVWMSFEDLIRVADLKTRPERMERVRREVQAAPGQPVTISEFLKPGVEEWCSVMPPWLARPLLTLAERTGVTKKLNVGMRLKTTTVLGFLPLWLVAKLRRWRRGTYRFRQEQAMIGQWLDQVMAAARADYALALEVADCARLVKGYGDTHHRGTRNFKLVMAALPSLIGRDDAAAQVKTLREAALANPEGGNLDQALERIGHPRQEIGMAAE